MHIHKFFFFLKLSSKVQAHKKHHLDMLELLGNNFSGVPSWWVASATGSSAGDGTLSHT